MQAPAGECSDVVAVTERVKAYVQQMIGYLPANFRVVNASRDDGAWVVEIYFVFVSSVLTVPSREIRAVVRVDERCRILEYREVQ